jgi:hypothetical protein
MDYGTTHTLSGVLTHCTPVGVLVYYVYQLILKRPLADLLPKSATARLWPWIRRPISFSPLAVLMVCLCVATGAATHVVWDAFTHRGRWGVEMIPQLSQVAIEEPIRIHWYGLLQHGSTLILLPVMAMGFLLWVRTLPPSGESTERAHMPRGLAWAVIALMLVATAMYFQMLRVEQPAWSLVTQIRTSVKNCGAVILAIVTLYCLGMHWLWWRDRGDVDVVLESQT